MAIPVSCCIILKDDHIVIAQKPNGVWEFPGGKQEPGETMFRCAVREVEEELGIAVEPMAELESHTIETGQGLRYELVPVVCNYLSGDIRLSDHIDSKWLHLSQLREVDWSEADKILLTIFEDYISHQPKQ